MISEDMLLENTLQTQIVGGGFSVWYFSKGNFRWIFNFAQECSTIITKMKLYISSCCADILLPAIVSFGQNIYITYSITLASWHSKHSNCYHKLCKWQLLQDTTSRQFCTQKRVSYKAKTSFVHSPLNV